MSPKRQRLQITMWQIARAKALNMAAKSGHERMPRGPQMGLDRNKHSFGTGLCFPVCRGKDFRVLSRPAQWLNLTFLQKVEKCRYKQREGEISR